MSQDEALHSVLPAYEALLREIRALGVRGGRTHASWGASPLRHQYPPTSLPPRASLTRIAVTLAGIGYIFRLPFTLAGAAGAGA